MIRHWPFASRYLRDFEVLEEHRDGQRFFPRTDQLPLLAKAIHREFEQGLTTRLANTDERADMWRKLQLQEAVRVFCTIINAARPDHLHVCPYYTPTLLARVAVVQHISQSCPEGLSHRFRFFAQDDFLPDVYLSGKPIGFASHAIERYAQRAVLTAFHPLTVFLNDFFESPKLAVRLGENRPALAFLTSDSMVAMPYKQIAGEYFFLTTLAPDQINTLTIPDPLPPMHLHYGAAYNPPVPCVYRSDLIALVQQYWREKRRPKDGRAHQQQLLATMSFTGLVQQIDRVLRKNGCDKNTILLFQDDIHSPSPIQGQWFPDP